jgi:lipopolysaccharide biosynthesis protein
MSKFLITYVYYETKSSIENLNFFIKRGIFENENVYYNFIINSDSISINIPRFKNVNIIKGDNRGYDFGAFSKSISAIDIKEFDYFIFINDTVRGPFLPRYVQTPWYELFVSLINDKIKLVGSTINRISLSTPRSPKEGSDRHVQSMVFSTDRVGLQLLIEKEIFNQDLCEMIYNKYGKWNFILTFEVGMSEIIISNGFDIASFLQVENNKEIILHGDVHFENNYFESTINPIEVMFIKTNRINNKDVRNYSLWNL